MRILHWNCQGLRNPLTIPYLKDINRKFKIDIMFLVETKNKDNYVQNLGVDLHFDHQILVSPDGLSGGLAIFWRNIVACELLSDPTLNYTDMYIIEGPTTFCLTYVYGNPERKPRQYMWQMMENLVKGGLYQRKPRLVLGDFNEIKNNQEKLGGPPRHEWLFLNFRRMLNVSGLHEVKTFGGVYTWIGNRSAGTIQSKLDRVVATAEWKDKYPKAMVQLLDWIGSDHKPLILHTEDNKWKGKKLFRYDNRWRTNRDVHAVLQNTWEQKCNMLPPHQFHEALKRCRHSLSTWKSEQNFNSHKKIQQLHMDIQQVANLDMVLQHIQPKVNVAMNQKLTEPVQEEEILQALSQMHVDKTPGPDGFMAGFYKYHWPTLKTEQWCTWVMKCVTSVTYSVLLNGSPTKKIIPSRGLRQEECQQILAVLDAYAHVSGGFGKYLGLPETVGQNKSDAFGFISQRVQQKLQRQIRRFWWSTLKDKQKIPWVAWRKMTTLKQYRGMGFRDLNLFNIALLAKQGWRILKEPQLLLSQVLRAKYFSKSSLMEAKPGYRPSHAWRSILQGMQLIKQGLRWSVADGNTIKAWHDPWLSNPPRPARCIGSPLNDSLPVSGLMKPTLNDWDDTKLQE
ncbi:uncharacterized protein LOC110226467 isoform X2 [Arabidopsis lyrata subsp. lyrata]|uniref:uncharacterized protein LOC110226467 isoform X2 n=1 Tax=Arabidopsis lyrata subsp. lyrata TaxID=81972 RepID=UPI000A29D28B|nr:uncharacterized protein LOC110226467 isoform X2 [Arabidopsis lyrata subsp. lyrata]|eukprot:XP_020873965.1 uncharacterized protein LOC110226467 isoform X2 [Arabidopsis lyrata subsp. lyrata]